MESLNPIISDIHFMKEAVLFRNDTEKGLHINAVRSLSAEAGVAIDEVCRLYETTLEQYVEDSTVRIYLSIFVTRKVKEKLQEKRG